MNSSLDSWYNKHIPVLPVLYKVHINYIRPEIIQELKPKGQFLIGRVVTDIADNKQKIYFGKDMIQEITDESFIMPVEVTPKILKTLKFEEQKENKTYCLYTAIGRIVVEFGDTTDVWTYDIDGNLKMMYTDLESLVYLQMIFKLLGLYLDVKVLLPGYLNSELELD